MIPKIGFQDLVDEDLGEDDLRGGARDLAVQLAVEPVGGGAVDEEAERGEAREARKVERVALLDEKLRQDVAEREANERSETLH